MRTWKALRIEFASGAAEAINAILWDLGMTGSVTESEDHTTVTWVAYFAPETKLPALTNRLQSLLPDYGAPHAIKRLEPLQVKDEDWLKRWKESYTAFEVGEQWVIAPT